MNVGFHDRGMGRGDYGIIDSEGNVLAEVKSSSENKPLLPDRANAFLFAGAPNLYAACRAALAALKEKNGDATEIAVLEAALKKATAP